MDSIQELKNTLSEIKRDYDVQINRLNELKAQFRNIVPRRIFQTWKEREVQNPVLRSWQNSWKELNPGYSYYIFDDTDNREFVKNNFPDMLELYDSYKENICRVDVIRYMYLYVNGGIYADLDFQCLQSFQPFIEQMEERGINVVMGGLGEMEKSEHNFHDIPNALIVSSVRTDFWLFVLQALKNMHIDTVQKACPEILTGPVFIKLCVQAYNNTVDTETVRSIYGSNIFENIQCDRSSNIFIEQPEIFYPINWGNRSHDKYRTRFHEGDELRILFPKALAATVWMHSW